MIDGIDIQKHYEMVITTNATTNAKTEEVKIKNAIKEKIIGAMWAVGGVLSAFIPGKIGGAVFVVCEAKKAAIRTDNQ